MKLDEMDDAERTLAKIHDMVVAAIAAGTTLTLTNHYIKPAMAQDLARMERAFKGLVRTVCRHTFKLKPRQIPDFYLNLQAGTWADDGDNTVTVHLDCGKLFPGERPAELLEAAKRLMDRYYSGGRPDEEASDARR